MSERRTTNIDVILLIILGVYCFLGKYKIFTLLGISTDYLFWIIISGVLTLGILINHYIPKNKTILASAIYIIYSLFEMVRGNGYSARIAFVFVFISVVFFLKVLNKKNLHILLLNILFWGGFFFTITVIIQLLVPDVINSLRVLLLSSRDYTISQMGYENTTNYLSGLAINSSCAAFFISIFNGIVFSKLLFEGKKMRNGVLLMLGLIALLLTQKRMLVIAFLLASLVTVLICKKDIAYKFKFIMLFAIVALIAFAYAIEKIPAMTIFIDRLFNNTNLLSGRENFYDEMLVWFKSNPVIGVGLGKANSVWGYGGHNCYIQLLAETGIIGFVIYMSFVGPFIISTIKKLIYYWNYTNVEDNKEIITTLVASVVGIIIILFYAISGNPFYDYIYCLTFFALIAVSSQIKEEWRCNNE